MIPIKNLYFLLCYSWGRLDEGDLVYVSSNSANTPLDLLVRVLIGGVNRVFKEGLDRGYITKDEETQSLRGRINFTHSIKKLLFHQGKAVVSADDLSHNILHNQIIKTTLKSLSSNFELDSQTRVELSRAARKFSDVDSVELNASIFKRVQLHQNNSFYAFLINICELIYQSSLPVSGGSEYKFRDFTRDEQKMSKVFQDFAYNLYRTKQDKFRVYSERLKWDIVNADDISVFPYMYTDVSLSSTDRKIILDTKYYLEAFQENWGVKKIRSDHLYQLNAYLDSSELPDSGSKVEGILLYPATSDEFTVKSLIRGHRITVAAVDLRKEPSEIESRMLSLLV